MNDDSKIDGLPDSGGNASPATVEGALGDFGRHLDSLIDERVEDSLFLTPTSSGRSASVGHARTRVRPRLASIAAVAAAFFVVASVVSLLTSDSTNEWASPVQPVDPLGALYLLPDPGLGLELSDEWSSQDWESTEESEVSPEVVTMTVGRRVETPADLGLPGGSTTFGQIAMIYVSVSQFSDELESFDFYEWTAVELESGPAWESDEFGTTVVQQRGELLLYATAGQGELAYVRDLVEAVKIEEGRPVLELAQLDLVLLPTASVLTGQDHSTGYSAGHDALEANVVVETATLDSLFFPGPGGAGSTMTRDDETQRWIGRYEDEAGAASYAVMWRETPNRVVFISGSDYLNESGDLNEAIDLDYLNEIADSLTQVEEDEWLGAFDS